MVDANQAAEGDARERLGLKCALHGMPRLEDGLCEQCRAEKAEADEEARKAARNLRILGAVIGPLLVLAVVYVTMKGRAEEAALRDAAAEARTHLRLVVYGAETDPTWKATRAWLDDKQVDYDARPASDQRIVQVFMTHPDAHVPIYAIDKIVLADGTPETIEQGLERAALARAEASARDSETKPPPHPFLSIDGILVIVFGLGSAFLVYVESVGALRIGVAATAASLILIPLIIPSLVVALVAKILLALLAIGCLFVLKAQGFLSMR